MEKEEPVKKEKIVIDNIKKETIDLSTFNRFDEEKQKESIKDTLNKMYDYSMKITNKMIMKCINLTFNPYDEEIYLPYNLKVEKRENNLIFTFVKKKTTGLILFFIGAIVFASIGATFSAIKVLSRSELNKDLNNDGIADINLDLDDDGICDINCDLDNDDIPDINIDYKNNRLAIFNIADSKTGLPKYNLINQDINNDGKCDLNCDLNDDNWPDINIDYYGEGKAVLDIDTDGDKVRDLNIDTDGDGVCDLMCDDNNDGKCDRACLAPEVIIVEKEPDPGKVEEIKDPSINSTGDPEINSATTDLLLIYNSGISIIVTDIFPDDQPEAGLYKPIPEKVITIENRSNMTLKYSLRWVIAQNTFISDNFKYKIDGTNGGGSFDFITVPKTNTVFMENVSIAAKTIQKYSITLKLQGTGENQDYDQGKVFVGHIEAFVN